MSQHNTTNTSAISTIASETQTTSNKRAVALRYQNDDLPRVVAKGNGYIAQQIIENAEKSGVPIHQDPALTQALSALDIQQAIPRALFEAVAQVLIFAFEIKRKHEEEQQKQC